MTSLGSSGLSYMKLLKPALEERGFEVAIFHATGMGGMAYEKIAAQGGVACVMDFALPELGNLLGRVGGQCRSGQDAERRTRRYSTNGRTGMSGSDRLCGWQEIPEQYADRPFHAHNRLIKSSALNDEERRETARAIAERLSPSKSPVHVFLPLHGIEDGTSRANQPTIPMALLPSSMKCVSASTPPVGMTEVEGHINDQIFADTVLALFDDWGGQGTC